LPQIAQLNRGGGGDILAEGLDRTGLREELACSRAEHGGLARAGATHHRDDLTARDRHRYIAQDGEGTVAKRDVVEPEDEIG